MKEVDLVLGPYADRTEDQFSEQDLNIFEALLEEMDQDIYAWFCDKQPIPQAYFNLILHIREFHKM